MGQQYLMDSNVVTDYFGNKLPPAGTTFIDGLTPVLSVISRIEILGWPGIKRKHKEKLSSFIENAFVYPLDESIILKTIILRQQHKIKTPDAIIAATALVYNHSLITNNIHDFKGIAGLTVVDAYTMLN